MPVFSGPVRYPTEQFNTCDQHDPTAALLNLMEYIGKPEADPLCAVPCIDTHRHVIVGWGFLPSEPRSQGGGYRPRPCWGGDYLGDLEGRN